MILSRQPQSGHLKIPSNAFQIAAPGPIQRRIGNWNMGSVSDRRKRIIAALPDRTHQGRDAGGAVWLIRPHEGRPSVIHGDHGIRRGRLLQAANARLLFSSVTGLSSFSPDPTGFAPFSSDLAISAAP